MERLEYYTILYKTLLVEVYNIQVVHAYIFYTLGGQHVQLALAVGISGSSGNICTRVVFNRIQ